MRQTHISTDTASVSGEVAGLSHSPTEGLVVANRYQIRREIGCGGSGTVYLARDLEIPRRVALKILREELTRRGEARRFLEEIKLTARLHHPHILPLLDTGTHEGRPFYVMPYVKRRSLRRRLAREGPLSLDDALRIASEIAEALAWAHEHRIVHRDVKPENILLAGGRAILADFGIAQAVDEAQGRRLTGSGLVLGTPEYMSPEQSDASRPVDERSDIYSLGVVLYEMLTGEPPFTGATPQAIMARRALTPAPSVHPLRPNVPPEIDRAMVRALERVPADRFRSAAEFAAVLVAARESSSRENAAAAVTWPRTTPAQPQAAVRAEGHTPGELATSPTWRRWPSARWLRRTITTVTALTFVTGFSVTGRHLHRWWLTRTLEPDLVAVAPFDLTGPDHGFGWWSNGLAASLYYTLNDAGRWRTVPPSRFFRAWQGPADANTVMQLGLRTHARLVVSGRITPAGNDSLRFEARVHDIRTGDELGIAVVHDLARVATIGRVTAALTVQLLQRLTGERVRRISSLGTLSPSAADAFLRAEVLYARGSLDTALAFYRQAVDLDSSFALALRRVGHVLSWQGATSDAESIDHLLRAGANNRGLAPRDSLLVLADSLAAAATRIEGDTAVSAAPYWRVVRRLGATLESALKRYDHDPEFWYALGEAHYHHRTGPAAVPTATILQAFDAAIALDSSFAPAYLHPIQLGFALGGASLAAKYLWGFISLEPTDIQGEGARLVAQLIDPSRAASPELEHAVEEASENGLAAARNMLEHSPDSLEWAVRVMRVLAGKRCADVSTASMCLGARAILGRVLAYRGHLTDALRVTQGLSFRPLFADLALARALPPDSIAAMFDAALTLGSDHTIFLLPSLLRQSDSVRMRAFWERADSVVRSSPNVADRERATYDAAAGRAYLALMRGDSAEAMRRFVELPDTLCFGCFRLDLLLRSTLLAAHGRLDEGQRILAGWRGTATLSDVLFALESARIARRRGDTAQAVENYSLVARAWANADAVLAPHVAEAREALTALAR